MKYYIDNIIVVEGHNDVSHLSSFIDALFVITNGYEIPKEEINFLNNKRNTKPVIVLTDSDEAGKSIRERLINALKRSINVEVDVVKCNRHNKHGIAECEKEEILRVLKEHVSDKSKAHTHIQASDLTSLGIDKEEREQLCKELDLGICNNKTFIKRLNYLGYTIEELKQYGNK